MITATTTKEHYEKYKSMVEGIELDLSRQNTVLGFNKKEMTNLFKYDNNLNNISLKRWDIFGAPLRTQVQYYKNKNGIKGGVSMADLVCVVKHAVIYQFIGAKFVEETRG